MLLSGHNDRGDTLVEVLFATAVFSLAAVLAYSMMNQGLATIERSLEMTLVRQEMDGQASALRFLNASYVAAYRPYAVSTDYPSGTPAREWANMVDSIVTTGNHDVTNFGLSASNTCPNPPKGSFITNPRTAKFIYPSDFSGAWKSPDTFAQLVYDASDNIEAKDGIKGIWIEAVRKKVNDTNQKGVGYIDFNIRACWDSPGQKTPVILGTIVRLYGPDDRNVYN
jgi:hypothetical protein